MAISRGHVVCIADGFFELIRVAFEPGLFTALAGHSPPVGKGVAAFLGNVNLVFLEMNLVGKDKTRFSYKWVVRLPARRSRSNGGRGARPR
jgi:hypothetical protein